MVDLTNHQIEEENPNETPRTMTDLSKTNNLNAQQLEASKKNDTGKDDGGSGLRDGDRGGRGYSYIKKNL